MPPAVSVAKKARRARGTGTPGVGEGGPPTRLPGTPNATLRHDPHVPVGAEVVFAVVAGASAAGLVPALVRERRHRRDIERRAAELEARNGELEGAAEERARLLEETNRLQVLAQVDEQRAAL